MKIKNIAAVLLLIWTCGSSSVVSAAEIHTVQLTEENQLVYTKDKAELAGAFCVGRCEEGVCVTVDDKFFSVSPETVDAFFKENILNAVQ